MTARHPKPQESNAAGENNGLYLQDMWSSLWEKVIDTNQQNFISFLNVHKDIVSSTTPGHHGVSIFDPEIMMSVFQKAFEKISKDPNQFITLQQQHMQDVLEIVHEVQQKIDGQSFTPLMEVSPKDKRFQNDMWQNNPTFFFMQQFYLINAKLLKDLVTRIPELDAETHKKLTFYTNQLVDALSPTNFPLTNPDVLKEIYETKGENLIQGFQNFLRDSAQGELQIRMTDMEALKLKEDIATTKGKVIFRNDLFELIQYTPTTKTVYETPLLIIPPWINKFYIFDLRPENSFIRWGLDQGLTIFIMSWINPDERHAEKTFTDYALEGAKTAIDTVRTITKQKSINTIGYCTGGVLLNSLLAYLKEKNDKSIKSATIIASPLDFKEAGDLLVFICDQQLDKLEKYVTRKGYLEGDAMVNSFNLLRANDLIWSFYVNNYLLGKDSLPFDMLHWNGDAVRMPAKMHTRFLRDMYLENRLIQPNGIFLNKVPININHIDLPLFIIAAKEDHIAPWKSVYPLSTTASGKNRFILAGSGHVAGIFNPPQKNKYYFLENNMEKLPASPEEWLKTASTTVGSWWPTWKEWIASFSGKQVPARKADPKSILDDAPGSYVLPDSKK